MSLTLILIILDALVLAALAATIYYARNLSRALSVLRNGGGEFTQRLEEMTGAIALANATIADLQGSGNAASRELKDEVDKGRALAQELKQICAAADSLTKRLEALSIRTRKALVPENTLDLPPVSLMSKKKDKENIPPSAFTIRDPEFDGAEIHSRAEREILAALQRRLSNIPKDPKNIPQKSRQVH